MSIYWHSLHNQYSHQLRCTVGLRGIHYSSFTHKCAAGIIRHNHHRVDVRQWVNIREQATAADFLKPLRRTNLCFLTIVHATKQVVSQKVQPSEAQGLHETATPAINLSIQFSSLIRVVIAALLAGLYF